MDWFTYFVTYARMFLYPLSWFVCVATGFIGAVMTLILPGALVVIAAREVKGRRLTTSILYIALTSLCLLVSYLTFIAYSNLLPAT